MSQAEEEEEEEKQEDSGDNKEKWELFYWKLRNRGNWIRYLFEEAKVDYIDHSVEGTDIMGYFTRFSDGNKNPSNNENPAFAPPAIRKGDLFINQSEVIINYLSEELKLSPTDKISKLHSSVILANCNDIIREIYGLRGKNKDESITFFEGGRFQKWLNVIKAPLIKHNKNDKDEIYYFENKCTFIDLIVFNFVDGLEELFGKKFEKYMESHPILIKHFKCIGQRESVCNLLKKQKEELKFKWFSGKSFVKMAEDMKFV